MIDRVIINHVRLNQSIRHCESRLLPTLSLVLELNEKNWTRWSIRPRSTPTGAGQVTRERVPVLRVPGAGQPLTKQQQKELRSLSSRAEITATSFVNEYNYGDFSGESQKLMECYFDAFCYLANWRTRRLMFRLPKTVLDARTARRYCHSDAASVTETADHVIIELCLERDPDDEWLEGSGLLAAWSRPVRPGRRRPAAAVPGMAARHPAGRRGG